MTPGQTSARQRRRRTRPRSAARVPRRHGAVPLCGAPRIRSAINKTAIKPPPPSACAPAKQPAASSYDRDLHPVFAIQPRRSANLSNTVVSHVDARATINPIPICSMTTWVTCQVRYPRCARQRQAGATARQSARRSPRGFRVWAEAASAISHPGPTEWATPLGPAAPFQDPVSLPKKTGHSSPRASPRPLTWMTFVRNWHCAAL